MPILENADRAIIDAAKFSAYALSPNHPTGRHKARVFRATLGYDLSNVADFVVRIRRAILTTNAVFLKDDRHGRHYRVDVTLEGPKGTAQVRTVWIYDRGSDVPRLTTAFVL